jgi:uncharacterized repeat protein (TIGR03803 family)
MPSPRGFWIFFRSHIGQGLVCFPRRNCLYLWVRFRYLAKIEDNSMRQKQLWFTLFGILIVLAGALMLPAGAVAASKYKVLYRFKGLDGVSPTASMVFDAAGNLYGTTGGGGSYDLGTVFKLTPNADGSWTESVLHSFSGSDAYYPVNGVIFDAAENLYGTTLDGGPYNNFGGTVFQLMPNGDGSWTESVLHTFAGPDGVTPVGNLIFDSAGNLFGTTSAGGLDGGGVVFQLTPNGDGSWTESLLHSFCTNRDKKCHDGSVPFADLIFDKAGNLYGTTTEMGTRKCIYNYNGCGTVFELIPQADGSWTENVLHRFTGPDGASPSAGLIFDKAGNLYGTTEGGGNLSDCNNNIGCGVVFKLKPNANGSWTEIVLHKFDNNPAAMPNRADLIFDEAGNLYGTTTSGGPVAGGTVFKLSPQSGGRWAFSVLHVFQGNPALHPTGGLVLDKAGNLYGTTESCASSSKCYGVVFEITP